MRDIKYNSEGYYAYTDSDSDDGEDSFDNIGKLNENDSSICGESFEYCNELKCPRCGCKLSINDTVCCSCGAHIDDKYRNGFKYTRVDKREKLGFGIKVFIVLFSVIGVLAGIIGVIKKDSMAGFVIMISFLSIAVKSLLLAWMYYSGLLEFMVTAVIGIIQSYLG